MPGDYDGDGRTDLALFHAGGTWDVRLSAGGTVTSPLGSDGDIPVPADYDGDGITDIAVFRPGDRSWHVLRSHVGGEWVRFYGLAGDVPIPAAFGTLAMYRPATGQWYVEGSAEIGGLPDGTPFGLSTDIPVPGDYDGDRIVDAAVYRPSTGEWFVLTSRSRFTSYVVYQWGLPGDVPLASGR